MPWPLPPLLRVAIAGWAAAAAAGDHVVYLRGDAATLQRLAVWNALLPLEALMLANAAEAQALADTGTLRLLRRRVWGATEYVAVRV
ncbi:hypothetical protein [Paracraurococcus ruber]|uniref:Uncharacterized protein n=1 Tax=Paracraurococcus ruber TaxID=77675 RepID=A0ABS1CQZ3_9PROT|nr:hypothetical protein [Paracraurococcus ruber]MBK1656862.1 hypothetical protein [Paracraurococcus ruber]TDG33976.1 hypothetical protein E2C05_01675 [Paracraurococcus ruber]